MTALAARSQNGTFAKQRFEPWMPDRPEIWNDGFTEPKGHFLVYRPDYPNSTVSGWAKRYHVVWWLRTGEVIRRPWLLHYKNEDKLDDRFDNLEKMEHGEHTRLHSSKPLVACVCVVCGETFYLPQWRINEGRGRFCSQPCAKAAPWSEERHKRHSRALRVAWAERSYSK